MLYFWQVLESIHEFILEIDVLQCFFVRGSDEKQRRGRIISNFTKGDFFISYINQVLLGIISQCGPSFCTFSIKVFLSLSVWARREYIWKLNWKESLLIYFENWQGAPCSHRQSRNRMMNTFIIVNITPICKRQFRGYIYACPHQKGPPYHFTWALIWKKSLLLTALFWKLPGYSIFPHRPSRQRMGNTLLMININPICKR